MEEFISFFVFWHLLSPYWSCCLGHYLWRVWGIDHVCRSDHALEDGDIVQLAHALESNRTLTTLNLQSECFLHADVIVVVVVMCSMCARGMESEMRIGAE
jgi:hypothetical protein